MTSATQSKISEKPAPPLWFSADGGRFAGDEPFFHDPEDFPWVKTLEDNWRPIKEEVEALLARREDRLSPYFHASMVFPPQSWKTLGFRFWTYRMHENCRDCPKTAKILESIPNLTAASVSVLEAGANINPHQGDTNAIVRIHLGLDIPEGLPGCGFQVGSEARPWEEGRVLMFCDAHTHTAWNRSSRPRMVLIVDVMRPEFAERQASICSRVLASIALQMVSQGRKIPPPAKPLLRALFQTTARVLLPLQQRLGR